METSLSPTGRFQIAISAWEARMSLWIESPTLLEVASGERLFAFEDQNWSLDAAEWQGESVVLLRLRKYPGNHLPSQLEATVDCQGRTAVLNGIRIEALGELERRLDEALEWRTAATPLPPARQGLGGLLRRLFGG